jgi:hypothetical protein
MAGAVGAEEEKGEDAVLNDGGTEARGAEPCTGAMPRLCEALAATAAAEVDSRTGAPGAAGACIAAAKGRD